MNETFAASAVSTLENSEIEELPVAQIASIDDHIIRSGALIPSQFDFSDKHTVEYLDAQSPSEAAEFFRKNSKLPHDCTIFVLCDASDSGISISYELALDKLAALYESADGHLYFVSEKYEIFAILKIPLWASVRTDGITICPSTDAV